MAQHTMFLLSQRKAEQGLNTKAGLSYYPGILSFILL